MLLSKVEGQCQFFPACTASHRIWRVEWHSAYAVATVIPLLSEATVKSATLWAFETFNVT